MSKKQKYLILTSLIGCGLILLVRITFWGHPTAWAQQVNYGDSFPVFFLFLVWNLFLAWIPYALSTRLKAFSGKKQIWSLSILSLWLLFYPNAPYIVTDLIHLRPRPPYPVWYDLSVLFSFAVTGLLLGAYSLINVQHWLSGLWPKMARALPWVAIPLGSTGVYLGRFLRWNSWDVFTRPLYLMDDLFEHLQSPGFLSEFLVLVLPLGFIQCLFYGILKDQPISEETNKKFISISDKSL